MSDEEFERRIGDRLSVDRRAFIKKMVIGAAFAAPVVASFNMVGVGAGTALGLNTSNTTGGTGTQCAQKEKQLRSVETAYAIVNATPHASQQSKNFLWNEILSLEQYLATHCGIGVF
jgi:uncharacterized membrane protein YcgQ (UPF0703/DUF1980 family)